MNKVLILGLVCLFAGEAASSQSTRRKIGFSGYVDGDFAGDFGSGFSNPTHATGLEADLTTTVTFTPRISAFLYTTLNDGSVPAQGAGNTWDDLDFDGAAFNWRYTHKTTLWVGDLTSGAGYFNYYRYKRSAAVVSESRVRGAGMQSQGLQVQTGVAEDTTGVARGWATYIEWKRPINSIMTWTPSARYTAGIKNASPFELGVTFEGRFENLFKIQAHFAMNYWNNNYDAGTVVLVEPTYTYDRYSLSATLFYNDKGEVPAPNSAQQTLSGVPLDDFLLYLEPAYALDKTFTVGLPLEYHNRRLTTDNDESVWIVPTLYVYPAPNAEIHVWGKLTKPLLATGSAADMNYGAGSEILFRF